MSCVKFHPIRNYPPGRISDFFSKFVRLCLGAEYKTVQEVVHCTLGDLAWPYGDHLVQGVLEELLIPPKCYLKADHFSISIGVLFSYTVQRGVTSDLIQPNQGLGRYLMTSICDLNARPHLTYNSSNNLGRNWITKGDLNKPVTSSDSPTVFVTYDDRGRPVIINANKRDWRWPQVSH